MVYEKQYIKWTISSLYNKNLLYNEKYFAVVLSDSGKNQFLTSILC